MLPISDIKEPVMFIMTGIQGSGKSTFCKAYLSDCERINLDTLHTRNKENKAIEAALSNKMNIVIDNTNPTVSDRSKYILAGKEAGYYIIGLFMQSILRDCLERNEKRSGKEKVPGKAFACTSNKLEIPSYCEGFDKLYFIEINDNDFIIHDWRQDNEI